MTDSHGQPPRPTPPYKGALLIYSRIDSNGKDRSSDIEHLRRGRATVMNVAIPGSGFEAAYRITHINEAGVWGEKLESVGEAM